MMGGPAPAARNATNVKDPRGRDLVDRSAAAGDAFVDVYRPGT